MAFPGRLALPLLNISTGLHVVYIFSFAWNLTFLIPILNQVLYLNAAGNNKAETSLRFFMESVQKHGWPSR